MEADKQGEGEGVDLRELEPEGCLCGSETFKRI